MNFSYSVLFPLISGNEMPSGGLYQTRFDKVGSPIPPGSTNLGASLAQVLAIAGLSDDYTRFLKMFAFAKTQFSLGNNRAGCDVLYKIWMDPRIIPALLLCECFY